MQKYKMAPAPSADIESSLIGYPPLVRQFLFTRGITDTETAEKFLNPSYDAHTHDPFLMKDMEKAVERILKAIQSNERIAIWSDYDADGIPGAVILHDFFKKIGFSNFENYIPDRHDEGFGLNSKAIEQLSNGGAKLLITIDCGITDVAEVARANELGMEVIITDHHIPLSKGGQGVVTLSKGGGESASRGLSSPLTQGAALGGCNNPPAEDGSAPFTKGDTTLPASESGTPFTKGDFPPAYAILNPKQPDCLYPEKMLCGSGVVFKLVQGLLAEIRRQPTTNNQQLTTGWEKWLLDMVGLATMSDMVPLQGENRVFAHFGLMVLRKSPRVGLGQLLQELRIAQRELTEDDIGFSVTPRINAASRMGVPMDAFRLFATEDPQEAGALAQHLNRINDERKGKVASLVKEVRKIVSERHMNGEPRVVVAGNPNWRPALLGLVANALVEDYQKPVFVWGRDAGAELKGSCRSAGGVDVTALMQEARHVFSDFGGHREAGGFSVVLEKVHLLEEELERAYEKLRHTRSDLESEERSDLVDARLSLEDVHWELWRELERLAPFGVGNPKPLFLFEQIIVGVNEQFGKEKQHLKLTFQKPNGERVSAVRFYAKLEDFPLSLAPGSRINLLAHVERSTFRDVPELRLRIVDCT